MQGEKLNFKTRSDDRPDYIIYALQQYIYAAVYIIENIRKIIAHIIITTHVPIYLIIIPNKMYVNAIVIFILFAQNPVSRVINDHSMTILYNRLIEDIFNHLFVLLGLYLHSALAKCITS